MLRRTFVILELQDNPWIFLCSDWYRVAFSGCLLNIDATATVIRGRSCLKCFALLYP